MKTAISLPDDLFEQVDRCARRLKLTRSGLMAAAAREFLASHASLEDPTEEWNRAIAATKQAGGDAREAAFRRASKARLRRRLAAER